MTASLNVILVTGATGFIGGRVCEALAQAGFSEIRALVHNHSHSARISRLPVELCGGNLLDQKSLDSALEHVKIVIHLGTGYGSAIPRGTKNLLSAAFAKGVKRFIHISTTAVYGLKPIPGCEDEDTAPRFTGNVYCDAKLRAERLVLEFGKRGLPVVIFRPSIVYGPYSRWSVRLISELQQAKGLLIDGGRGICNALYVDNLVDAILLALERPEASGQIFFLRDQEVLTWGDFIRAHADMLEPPAALKDISSEQISAYHRSRGGMWVESARAARRLVITPEFRNFLREIPLTERLLTWAWSSTQHLGRAGKEHLRARIAGNGHRIQPPSIPDLDTWSIQSNTVLFSLSKATKILGYHPRVTFAEGIHRTHEWLRFANYLPNEHSYSVAV
jgi:nucleoside-diphosphate-sugar epimerase